MIEVLMISRGVKVSAARKVLIKKLKKPRRGRGQEPSANPAYRVPKNLNNTMLATSPIVIGVPIASKASVRARSIVGTRMRWMMRGCQLCMEIIFALLKTKKVKPEGRRR